MRLGNGGGKETVQRGKVGRVGQVGDDGRMIIQGEDKSVVGGDGVAACKTRAVEQSGAASERHNMENHRIMGSTNPRTWDACHRRWRLRVPPVIKKPHPLPLFLMVLLQFYDGSGIDNISGHN